MSLNKTYSAAYAGVCESLPFYMKALSEGAGHTVVVTAEAGGIEAVRAMFDAILDSGGRNVLVQALNSPSLPRWARDHLETLLYGSARQKVCALMAKNWLH